MVVDYVEAVVELAHFINSNNQKKEDENLEKCQSLRERLMRMRGCDEMPKCFYDKFFPLFFKYVQMPVEPTTWDSMEHNGLSHLNNSNVLRRLHKGERTNTDRIYDLKQIKVKPDIINNINSRSSLINECILISSS